MAKTETLNLRVSADFKRRLMEEAAKEKRSVTNYLEVVLADLWEHRNTRFQRKVEKVSRK
jgi:predicted HicB family RNase H-like nuclease